MKNKSKIPVKHYTYSVSVSFETQFTFSEKDVQPADGGGENDFDPSDQALAGLEKELEDHLKQHFYVDKIEAWADFDNLLGVDELSDD